jgi:hypothetical protein
MKFVLSSPFTTLLLAVSLSGTTIISFGQAQEQSRAHGVTNLVLGCVPCFALACPPGKGTARKGKGTARKGKQKQLLEHLIIDFVAKSKHFRLFIKK